MTTPPTPVRRGGAAGTLMVLAMVATGLLAGVFYAYACSVMPGLARADDHTFVTAMRQINVAIQNPVFFASFFGAVLLCGVTAVLSRRAGRTGATRWVVAALVLNVLGFLVTTAASVPLNNQLAAASDPAHLRAGFESAWNAWNVVRALLHTAALAALGPALLRHGRRPSVR